MQPSGIPDNLPSRRLELRARFAKGDEALERRFDAHVKNVIGQAIREAREQDYR